MLTYEDRRLILAALEVIGQTNGLGFSEEEVNRAKQLAFLLEDEDNELFFSVDNLEELDDRTLEEISFKVSMELFDRDIRDC